MAAVSWPKLQTLNLSKNSLDGAGFRALSKARLPMLAELVLQSIPGRRVFTNALVSADWPRLMHLDLLGCGWYRDASCMETLISGRWPLMQSLVLGSGFHSSHNCRTLPQAQWPLLASLDLSTTRCFLSVSSDCLMELAKGVWPSLGFLSLRDCELMLDTSPGNLVQVLTTAEWPKLQRLDLSENRLAKGLEGGQISVINLLHQKWPMMSSLWLPSGWLSSLQCRYDLSKIRAPGATTRDLVRQETRHS